MREQIPEDQVKIPFMIKFNEYVNGQTYEGNTTLSIRNYGTSYDAAMLQEPVTNMAAQLVDMPATDTAYAGFKFNDGEEKLYVISELVNENYLAKYFENANGILYKAELGSTLSYVDEDPSSYANSFTQQTRVNDADHAASYQLHAPSSVNRTMPRLKRNCQTIWTWIHLRLISQ